MTTYLVTTKTSGRCTMQLAHTCTYVSIDPKIVELAADVRIILYKHR